MNTIIRQKTDREVKTHHKCKKSKKKHNSWKINGQLQLYTLVNTNTNPNPNTITLTLTLTLTLA